MLSLPTTAGTKSLAKSRYFLGSVPVGVPQRESTQRTLRSQRNISRHLPTDKPDFNEDHFSVNRGNA